MAIGALSTGLACWSMRAAGAPIEPATIGLAAAAAVAGSLAPDLDHPFSKASFGIPSALLAYGGGFLLAAFVQGRMHGPQLFRLSMLGPGYFAAARTAVGVGVVLLLLSLAFGAVFEHRGPIHSVAFGGLASVVFLIAAAALGAPVWLVLPFAWGWAAHLIADATTRMGVPRLLWPFDSSTVTVPSFWHRKTTVPVLPPAMTDSPRVGPVATHAAIQEAPAAAPSAPVCPHCGVHMVLRTARRGTNAGRSFYGCANFPRCRQTQRIL